MTRTTRHIWMIGAAAAAAAFALTTGIAPISAGTSAGSVDLTYGTDGFDDLDAPAGTYSSVLSIEAHGTDGQVYIAQTGDTVSNRRVVVGRLDGNGEIDTTFGTSGAWSHLGSVQQPQPHGIAVDGSDRIYVLATFVDGNGDYVAGLVRLLANGTVDTTYGSQGFVDTIDNDLAVTSAGQAVLAASVVNKGKTTWAARRLDADGDEDTTFGKRGEWVASFSAREGAEGVQLDSEGRILLFGESRDSGSTEQVIVRLTAGGDLDTTFGVPPAAASTVVSNARGGGGNGNGGGGGGGGGDSSPDGGLITISAFDMLDVAAGASGSFYVSGTVDLGTTSAPNQDPCVARFLATGLADTSFGDGTGSLAGVAFPDLAGRQLGRRIVISAGKIVQAGGQTESGSTIESQDFMVFRYDALTGAPDTAFGPGGDGASEEGDTGISEIAVDVGIDGSGDILVVGRARDFAVPSSTDPYAMLIARYCW